MDLQYIFKKVESHTPSILGHKEFSAFAVLLPLVIVENDIHVLFEVRSQKMRRQPGEICFPGGRIDKQDQTTREAAIRETMEELGISREQITNVFPMDYLVSPYGMIVYSFIGLIQDLTVIHPNSTEVEELFTVPLSFFLNTQPEKYKIHTKLEPEENFPFELIPGGKNYNWRVRTIDEIFYLYEDKVIWGLTAKVLSHFLEILNESINLD